MFLLNDNLCYIYWFRFESSNLKWDLTIFILYLLIIIKKKNSQNNLDRYLSKINYHAVLLFIFI